MSDDLPTPSLSALAARLFTVQAARAQKAMREERQTKDQADAALRPWLALACMAGADLPHFEPLLAERRETDLASGEMKLGEARLRALVALDICKRQDVLRTLEQARDKAFDALPDAADPNSPAHEQACALNRLANHFGCKPYLPGCTASQRKAA